MALVKHMLCQPLPLCISHCVEELCFRQAGWLTKMAGRCLRSGVGPRALSNGINSAVFFCFFEALRGAIKRRQAEVPPRGPPSPPSHCSAFLNTGCHAKGPLALPCPGEPADYSTCAARATFLGSPRECVCSRCCNSATHMPCHLFVCGPDPRACAQRLLRSAAQRTAPLGRALVDTGRGSRVARGVAASAPALPLGNIELTAAPVAVAFQPLGGSRARLCRRCCA